MIPSKKSLAWTKKARLVITALVQSHQLYDSHFGLECSQWIREGGTGTWLRDSLSLTLELVVHRKRVVYFEFSTIDLFAW